MTGEILRWPAQPVSGARFENAAVSSHIKFRLQGILALIRAVEGGELLAAVPESDAEQAYFRTTLSLLALAEKEVLEISQYLTDAGH